MDLLSLNEFNIEDIQSLIDNEVEENVHLDYKAGEALKKNDSGKNEITKDVSSFANSDGGIIIYGLKEINHKPSEISPVDGKDFTKERLEQIIANIQPHIKGVTIHPIRVEGDISKSIYVVKIPRGITLHMATDHRYYKRSNFQSIAMEDYEVKDLFYRHNISNLFIDNCTLKILSSNRGSTIYQFCTKIVNDSNVSEMLYKLNCYIINYNVGKYDFFVEDKGNYTEMNKSTLKISFTGIEPLFPFECLDMGRFRIEVPYDYVDDFEKHSTIELKLFYENRIDEYNIFVYKLLK